MRWLGSLLCLCLLLGVVGCDHTTKQLALSELAPGGPVSLVRGWVELRYVTNTDTAFTVLRHVFGPETRFVVVVVAQAVANLGLAVWLLWHWPTFRLCERAGAAVLLGGGISNLLDRLVRGHVIDFIHVSYWPVFNVADVAICVGVGLLLLGAQQRRGRASALWGR